MKRGNDFKLLVASLIYVDTKESEHASMSDFKQVCKNMSIKYSRVFPIVDELKLDVAI